LRGRGAAVVTDPYPPAIGLKLSRMDAEVVTVSHEHENHNYTQVVRDGAYEIRGPGEYEVAGVSVIGVPTFHDEDKGAKHGRNTVYLIEIDDVRVCRLGAPAQAVGPEVVSGRIRDQSHRPGTQGRAKGLTDGLLR